MSKSLGNVVDPKKYLEEFGSDPLRYYLTKEINIENDGVFSRDLFIGIFNNDLANTYGNLVSRFIGMCIKFNNRIIKKENIKLDAETSKLVKAMKNTFSHTKKFINNFEINKLLKSILELGEIANKYIEIMKP
jgi:methionyl-tRNA synthetase